MWFSNVKPEIKGRQTKKTTIPRYLDKYVDAWREFSFSSSVSIFSLETLVSSSQCDTARSLVDPGLKPVEPGGVMTPWNLRLACLTIKHGCLSCANTPPLHVLWPQNLTETYWIGWQSNCKCQHLSGRNLRCKIPRKSEVNIPHCLVVMR